MNKLYTLSAAEISRHIGQKAYSREEVHSFFKTRACSLDSRFKAFVEVYAAGAGGGGSSALSGVPIAVKDNICIKNKRISCASRILDSHIAVYDATVISRLKKAGMLIFGTTNMDEFAFGSSTENSCYGPSRNPWDVERVPGGSSGGSAAAVAARLVPCALGSDTGGSIRQPAALCGVVGFKPTYGRISRYGLIAFGSSLDQIGPITTNFTDCAHLLNILCGFDPADATTSQKEPPDFTRFLVPGLKDVKIGMPKEYFSQGLDAEVEQSLQATAKVFRDLGAKIVEVSLPHTEYAVATYYIIAPSEASSNLQRFDGIKYGIRKGGKTLMELYKKTRAAGFGDEAKRRILIGTHSLSSGYYEAYYLRALKVRTLISRDFNEAFKKADVLLTPTSPTPAFKIGEKSDDPLKMYLSDVYTISANLAGTCAVSFPCGFTKDKLPIGAQLIGKNFDEGALIRAGYAFQEVTGFHKEIPPLAGDA